MRPRTPARWRIVAFRWPRGPAPASQRHRQRMESQWTGRPSTGTAATSPDARHPLRRTPITSHALAMVQPSSTRRRTRHHKHPHSDRHHRHRSEQQPQVSGSHRGDGGQKHRDDDADVYGSGAHTELLSVEHTCCLMSGQRGECRSGSSVCLASEASSGFRIWTGCLDPRLMRDAHGDFRRVFRRRFSSSLRLRPS